MEESIRDISVHLRCEDRLVRAASEFLRTDYQMMYLDTPGFIFLIDSNTNMYNAFECDKFLINNRNYKKLLYEFHNIVYEQERVNYLELKNILKCNTQTVFGVNISSKTYKKIMKIDDLISIHGFYPMLIIYYDAKQNNIFLYDVHLTFGVIETSPDIFFDDISTVELFKYQKINKICKPITMDLLFNEFEYNKHIGCFQKAILTSYDQNCKSKEKFLIQLKEQVRANYLYIITLKYIYEKTNNSILLKYIATYTSLADNWNILWSALYKYFKKNCNIDSEEVMTYLNNIIRLDSELHNYFHNRQDGLNDVINNKIIKKYKNDYISGKNFKCYNVQLDKYKNNTYSVKSIKNIGLDLIENITANGESKRFFLDQDISPFITDTKFDNIICNGQKIYCDNYKPTFQVVLWGFSDDGNYDEYLDIIYKDTTTERVKFSMSDKMGAPCFNEIVAWKSPIVLVKEGKSLLLQVSANVYKISISLNYNKVIKYISLPDFSSIHIINIELCSKEE